MWERLLVAYDWLKAGHLIFVIFWMAGLFALPRYLVYHQENLQDAADAARWVERESKLRHIIRTLRMLNEVPALGIAIIVVLVIVKPL